MRAHRRLFYISNIWVILILTYVTPFARVRDVRFAPFVSRLSTAAITVYQEKVIEFELHAEFPEDYHMRITTEKYVWNSRNIKVTSMGFGLTVVGAICLFYSMLQSLVKEERAHT